MNDESREALNAYYAQADSWARDRQDDVRASRRIAWWVAGGASVVAVLEACALIILTPLKTVQPYTLMVDRHTGFVQALSPLDPRTISGDAALTQSFLVQYVIARESFDIDGLQANYRKVALWSADSARAGYVAGQQASNPDSPLARLPRSTIVETAVKSVSQVEPYVAMVRFETIRRDTGGQPRSPQAWVAIVRYRFSGEPMRLEDRMINPLGFQVVRYQRNAEMLNPQAAAAQPAQAYAQPGAAVPARVVVQGAPAPVVVQTAPATTTVDAARPAAVAVAPAPAATPVQLLLPPVQQTQQGGRGRGPNGQGNFQGFGNGRGPGTGPDAGQGNRRGGQGQSQGQ